MRAKATAPRAHVAQQTARSVLQLLAWTWCLVKLCYWNCFEWYNALNLNKSLVVSINQCYAMLKIHVHDINPGSRRGRSRLPSVTGMWRLAASEAWPGPRLITITQPSSLNCNPKAPSDGVFCPERLLFFT
jgi:hypothetical protein